MAFSAYNALGAISVLDEMERLERKRLEQASQQSDAQRVTWTAPQATAEPGVPMGTGPLHGPTGLADPADAEAQGSVS